MIIIVVVKISGFPDMSTLDWIQGDTSSIPIIDAHVMVCSLHSALDTCHTFITCSWHPTPNLTDTAASVDWAPTSAHGRAPCIHYLVHNNLQ